MRVTIADFRVTGNEHLVINSAIAEGFVANNFSEIDFFAEKDHAIALTKEFPITMKGVRFKYFPKSYYSDKIRTLFFRELILPLKLLWVILHAKRNSDFLLITTITPFGHLILNFFALLFARDFSFSVLLHSELEQIEARKSSFSKVMIKAWMLTVTNKVNYFVLSPHIENRLKSKKLPNIRVASIFHPFPNEILSKYASRPCEKTCKTVLKIGVPGLVKSGAKNANAIFDLEKRLLASGRDDIELYLIGRAAKGFKKPSNTTVEMPFLDRTTPVPQSEFDALIAQMDVIILMYDKDGYKYTASGAVLDVLKFGQPLYATRNHLFDHMDAEGIFPGFLAESIDSLFDEIVENLSSTNLHNEKDKYAKAIASLIKRTDPGENINALIKAAAE